MLVPTAGVARDNERHLRQLAEMKVIQVLAFAATSALVVRPTLPENKHIVGIAVGNAILADVVNLPSDARGVEQVEDDWVIEHAVPPDAIGCDAARSSGGEVEPVGPG